MKTMGYGKSHLLKSVLRLCVCLVVCGVLVLGGVGLFAPIPAYATCGINLFPNATEGQSYSTLVTSTSTGGGYTCKVVAFDTVYTNPPLPFPWSFNPSTAVFSCNPPIGSAGTYTICFHCQEYNASGACYPSGGCGGPCYPAGNTQCQKCTTLTILPASTTSTPPIIIYTPPPTPATSQFTVNIDSGLANATTTVTLESGNSVEMTGGQTRSFTAPPTSHTVTVTDTVFSADKGTKYVAKASSKTVDPNNPSVTFNYLPQYLVQCYTEPSGIASLPGNNTYYAAGDTARLSAPSTIELPSQQGSRYTFLQWRGPGGLQNQGTDMMLTVNAPTNLYASYQQSYQLTLISTDPLFEKKIWLPSNKDAQYDIGVKTLSMGGFLGFIGCKYNVVNGTGTKNLSAPETVPVIWEKNYLPLWIMLIVLALIVGGVFAYRRFAPAREVALSTAAKPQAATEVTIKKVASGKKTSSRAKPPAKSKS